MAIPTYEERIKAMFGDELNEIQDSINTAILHGRSNEHNDGYTYYTARVGDKWINEELRKWLFKEYTDAGWGLNFVWENPHDENGDCMVEIYTYKGV